MDANPYNMLSIAKKVTINAGKAYEKLQQDRHAAYTTSREALVAFISSLPQTGTADPTLMDTQDAQRLVATGSRCIAAEEALSTASRLLITSLQELGEALTEENRARDQFLNSMRLIQEQRRREMPGIRQRERERAVERLAAMEKERQEKLARERERAEALTRERKERQAKLAEEKQQRQEKLANEALRQRRAEALAAMTPTERIAAWKDELDTAFADYATMQTFPAPPLIPCAQPECSSRIVADRLLQSCDCIVRTAFQGVGKQALKVERRRWHPDKFTRCPGGAS